MIFAYNGGFTDFVSRNYKESASLKSTLVLFEQKDMLNKISIKSESKVLETILTVWHHHDTFIVFYKNISLQGKFKKKLLSLIITAWDWYSIYLHFQTTILFSFVSFFQVKMRVGTTDITYKAKNLVYIYISCIMTYSFYNWGRVDIEKESLKL